MLATRASLSATTAGNCNACSRCDQVETLPRHPQIPRSTPPLSRRALGAARVTSHADEEQPSPRWSLQSQNAPLLASHASHRGAAESARSPRARSAGAGYRGFRPRCCAEVLGGTSTPTWCCHSMLWVRRPLAPPPIRALRCSYGTGSRRRPPQIDFSPDAESRRLRWLCYGTPVLRNPTPRLA